VLSGKQFQIRKNFWKVGSGVDSDGGKTKLEGR
jgi:hypothetical protein